MRKYELVCVFRQEQDQYTQAKAKVSEHLSKVGAEIKKEEDMGERQLAYQIKKQSRGHYYLWLFTAAPDAIAKLEHELKYVDGILRFLVTRVED
ncbi:30S ribosomal protein S6 [Spirochaetia bacterium 38H-sp]|uniref:Small ribosomal subunit protein bS6 n=1 Tax=Rarispira pelagica TaxID=3141764 RepID=A0ABU9UCG8_9SPIR